jgi:hypothetical protein
MKNAVFLDVTPCGVSEERTASIIGVTGIGEVVFLLEVLLLLTAANAVFDWSIPVTLDDGGDTFL